MPIAAPSPGSCRPVTIADPAPFCCGRLRLADGSPNPDYGKVFWAEDGQGVVMFSYDRAGDLFAATYGARADLPADGWLIKQGRAFKIAGPSAVHALWSHYGCAGRMGAGEKAAA
jgi:hypothetical protein